MYYCFIYEMHQLLAEIICCIISKYWQRKKKTILYAIHKTFIHYFHEFTNACFCCSRLLPPEEQLEEEAVVDDAAEVTLEKIEEEMMEVRADLCVCLFVCMHIQVRACLSLSLLLCVLKMDVCFCNRCSSKRLLPATYLCQEHLAATLQMVKFNIDSCQLPRIIVK